MFSAFLKKHHFVLKKGRDFHILSQIGVNWLMLMWLRLKKWLRGIHRPIVHYYAVCWNEEKMLPFMFDYYERFVDRFTIYDNCSDDRSVEIVRSHKNAIVIKFQTDGFDDTVHAHIKNNCWKRSRGKADYVIVCDVDEFLYHQELGKTLMESNKRGDSLLVAKGYNMFSESFPTQGESIVEQLKLGVADDAYSKTIIFDPHRIVEINFLPGAHELSPWGIVKQGNVQLQLLHYKHLGLDYLLDRHQLLGKRLSEKNKEQDLGTHYMYSEDKVISDFNLGIKKSHLVI